MKQEITSKHKITYDEFNPRVYCEEVQCSGCEEWFNKDDVTEKDTDEYYCSDCIEDDEETW